MHVGCEGSVMQGTSTHANYANVLILQQNALVWAEETTGYCCYPRNPLVAPSRWENTDVGWGIWVP
jgi:hypothetical protein